MECLRVLCVFNVILCGAHKQKHLDLQIFQVDEEEEDEATQLTIYFCKRKILFVKS